MFVPGSGYGGGSRKCRGTGLEIGVERCVKSVVGDKTTTESSIVGTWTKVYW